MEPEQHYCDFALSAVIEDTPALFWQRIADRSRFTYGDSFMQIPAHRGQSFRRIADSIPVIADSF